jgi:tetratricopeptide (TPR) repeat protein
MIVKGVEPEAAVEQYLGLDINALIDLDRLYELSLGKQRQRDEITGFRIADVITENFRSEPVFLTPYHPGTRVTAALATQFFEKMNVAQDDIARMQRAIEIAPPFPADELPIHPSVIAHFKLQFVADGHRFRFMNEGRFSFREFASRYLRCSWNEPLARGLHMLRNRDFAGAREALGAGLAASPDSPAGHAAMSHVLAHFGELEAAVASAERAIALAPDRAAHHGELGGLLRRTGDTDGAAEAFRRAIALDPYEPHFALLLARTLRAEGRAAEALPVLREAVGYNPYAAELPAELAVASAASGDDEQALAGFWHGMRLDPNGAGVAAAVELAEFYRQQDRILDGVTVLKAAVQHAPTRPEPQARLACWLDLAGHRDEAAAAWRRALELAAEAGQSDRELLPLVQRVGNIDLIERAACYALQCDPADAAAQLALCLAQIDVLRRAGQLEDAVAAASAAAAGRPDSIELHSRLGDLALATGKPALAEAAFRRLVTLDPRHSHAYSQLGHALALLGRYTEAIAMREKSVEIEPANPHRIAQLGAVLMEAGAFDPAEEKIRAAIAAAPDVAEFWITLSHLLSRAGRADEAIDAARSGVAAEPANPRFQAHLDELQRRAAVQAVPATVAAAMAQA